MNELKPCPFCGGEAQVQHQSRELYGDAVDWYGVYCKKQFCGYVSGQSTEAEAIEAWNSRAERTCEMETDHDELEVIAYSHEDTWAYKCSACDWSFRYDRGIKPNYCPNCGAKVVSE